jgi:ATP-dependent helicase HepA
MVDLVPEFSGLMKGMTLSLGKFLSGVLPLIESNSDDWWNTRVRDRLSYAQQRRIETNRITTLSGLDIQALLRILDKNWFDISEELNLPKEQLYYVKEMISIRNRLYHADSHDPPKEDQYRDIDTAQRLARIINAEDELDEIIKSIKSKLGYGVEIDTKKLLLNDNNELLDFEFKVGQIVFPIAKPELRGAIISVNRGDPENRYDVFIEGSKKSFYASQIKSENESSSPQCLLTSFEFHSYLTSLQILHPGLANLYSLHAARVNFIPYQFRPVLKLMRSDRPRLLVADSVGVGKTIEAGLILRELQARSEINSVLVICTKPLVVENKWRDEMKRFDERFTQLDGKTLRYCIDEMDKEGAWPEEHNKTIIPFSLLDESAMYGTGGNGRQSKRQGLLDLDPPPRFDVVIVDEAHHARNPDTSNYKLVRFFCDQAEAVIFLTATPIQLGNDDLLVLLNLIRPDIIIDRQSFEHMSEPNPFINKAIELVRNAKKDWKIDASNELDLAAETSWGQAVFKNNPEFSRARERFSKNEFKKEERIQLIGELEALHTFSGIINRTRRRDIGEFTIRKSETVEIGFTQDQKELHDEILRVQAEVFQSLHGDKNINFFMTTIRRQVSSCLGGLVPLLEDILTRRLKDLLSDEMIITEDILIEGTIKKIEASIKSILNKAKTLDERDPKLDELRKVLEKKQEHDNNKVIVFSSFRHTLAYLHERLLAYGLRVGLIHGDIPDLDRIDIRKRFKLNRSDKEALDILLFSEVGCEGLDYQFCNCIINYDIQWNPMKIEQRIGRIDRMGQESESVAIFNFVTPGTIDAEIYNRCLQRIGVFKSALGGSEEILGKITREIRNISDNFLVNEKERAEKLQQLADNQIRKMKEEEDLEEKQAELFGIKFPPGQFEKEIKEASSYWLSPSAIQNLLTVYLKNLLGKDQEFILGDSVIKKLRISQEDRNKILDDFKKLPRQSTPPYHKWEAWLKGGDPHLSITLNASHAIDNPKVESLTPIHPLIKQAARSFDYNRPVKSSLRVKLGDDLALKTLPPIGTHPFAIYQWHFHGIREDVVLRLVSRDQSITDNWQTLLEKAEAGETIPVELSESSSYEELTKIQYDLWSKAREDHRARERDLAQYRRESLTSSHEARIALLGDQLSQSTNDKIKRMRQSQIDSANADYARRIQELEIAMERTDVHAQLIVNGTIEVEER